MSELHLRHVPIKADPEEMYCGADLIKIESERALLYEDHDIKDDIVIGPTEIRRPLPVNLEAEELEPRQAPYKFSHEVKVEAVEESTHTTPATHPCTRQGLQPRVALIGCGLGQPHFIAVRRALAIKTVDELRLYLQSLNNCRLVLRDAADELLCAFCGQWCLTRAALHTHQQSAHSFQPKDILIKTEIENCFQATTFTEPLGNCAQQSLKRMPNKAYICDLCHKQYKRKAFLAKHVHLHYTEIDSKPFLCEICRKRFRLKRHLFEHTIVHVPICDKIKFNQCDQSYTKKSLPQHRGSHNVNPHLCDECGMSFSQKVQLTHHILRHKNDKPMTCNQCGKRYKDRFRLLKHLRYHSNQCDQSYTKKSLPQHRGSHNVNPHLCDECGMSFSQKIQLTHHILRHKNDKPMTCNQCGKLYKNRSRLLKHLRYHRHTPKVICDLCGKNYTSKYILANHISIDHYSQNIPSCHKCGKNYKTKSGLRYHLKIHDILHSCDHCGKCFRAKSGLSCHKLKEHRDNLEQPKNPLRVPTQVIPHKTFICDLCQRHFDKKSNLAKHIHEHWTQPFSCSICDKRFSVKLDLNEHKVVHHPLSAMVTCDKCNERFTGKAALRQHKLTHEDHAFVCHHCGKYFKKRNYLTTHIHEKHTTTSNASQSFSCSQCKRCFPKKRQLNRHLLRSHNGKQFPCDKCDKHFYTKGELVAHSVTHSGIKPYKCEKCDKRFTNKSYLVRHCFTCQKPKSLSSNGNDSKDKPFLCDKCYKYFKFKGSLKRHYVIYHAGKQKPRELFYCDKCDKIFTQKDSLARHLLNIHSSIKLKPFPCPKCNKCFGRKDNLARHLANSQCRLSTNSYSVVHS